MAAEGKKHERSVGTPAAKGKLTLSVAPEYVALLRKAGARKGRTISELVEEFAMDLEHTSTPSEKILWADRVNGKAENAFSDIDYSRNDLLGAMLRKHLPRTRRGA